MSMFHNMRKQAHKISENEVKNKIGEHELFPILSAHELLKTERCQQLLKVLPSLSQLPLKEYQSLYFELVCVFAEFVQKLPETKSGYYPYAGGLLDHGLERAIRALALSRHFVSIQEGAAKEMFLKQAMLRYVIFSVALLYDVGRLSTKLSVGIYDKNKNFLKQWHPVDGVMVGQGAYYKYNFEKENWDYLRGKVTPLLARQLMSLVGRGLTSDKLINAKDGFSWIAQDKEILETWFAFFKEDMQGLDTVLSIIPLADAQTIAGYFDLDRPLQELAQPHEGFWDTYGEAIEKYTIAKQQKEENVKMHHDKNEKISVAVELDVIKEKEREKEMPLDKRLFETMQGEDASRKMATVPGGATAGLAFYLWLLKSIRGKQLTVNQPNSLLHRVNEGILLTNELFQEFANSQSHFKNVAVIQQQFSSMGLALMNASNQPMFQYLVTRVGMTSPREGMLLQNPYLLFHTLNAMPEVNKNLQLIGGALGNFAVSQILLQSSPGEIKIKFHMPPGGAR